MKLGDFVTAKIINTDDCRQGVVTCIMHNCIEVTGMHDIYYCDENATVVPDANIIIHSEFVNSMRERHSLDWYGGLDYPKAGR